MKYDVKIHNLSTTGAIRAFASVNLNEEFAITSIKIMEGSKGIFVAMPSYKTANGYKDVCFPITKEARENFNKAVLEAYEQTLAQIQAKGQKTTDMPTHNQEMTMQ